MTSSEALRRAKKKYESEKVDHISLRLPKGHKERIQQHAAGKGESINAFVCRAINEVIAQEQKFDETEHSDMLLERYKISDATITIIGEFSILWCRFEQVYFAARATQRGVKELADRCTVDGELSSLYHAIKPTAIEYLRNPDISTIEYRIYSEDRSGSEENIQHIYKFLNAESIDIIGCFLFIQRIRNNLFHGLKDIYSLDKQQKMFISICKFLDYILQRDYC